MSASPWVTDASAALPSARRNNGKTRGTVNTSPRVSTATNALAHASYFVMLCFILYGLLSLMGHSLHSSAMKQRQNAELRTEGAREDVMELGRQVSALLTVESIDRWAKSHGFVKSGTRTTGAYVTVGYQKAE